jgi:hypothetical protein
MTQPETTPPAPPTETAPLTPTPVESANIKPAQDPPPSNSNTVGKIVPQTEPAPQGMMSQLWDAYLARRERILAEQKQNPGQVVGELAQILITRGRTIKGGAGVKPPNTVPQTAAPKPVTAPAPKAGLPAATPAAPTTAAPAQGKGGGYSTGRGKNAHEKCGKKVKYNSKELKGTGLEKDHTPSGAALRAAADKAILEAKKNGVEISKTQVTSIKNSVVNNAPTIGVPPDIHRAGETWGSKNNDAMVARDIDPKQGGLKGATDRNTKAMSDAMKDKDNGCKDAYDKSAEELKKFDWDKHISDTIDKFTKKK